MSISPVLIARLGYSGNSKGEDIPEKSFRIPALAFAYRPFTSLPSQTDNSALRKISLNRFSPIMFLTKFLISFVGLMKDAITRMPLSDKSFAISAALLMFSDHF